MERWGGWASIGGDENGSGGKKRGGGNNRKWFRTLPNFPPTLFVRLSTITYCSVLANIIHCKLLFLSYGQVPGKEGDSVDGGNHDHRDGE